MTCRKVGVLRPTKIGMLVSIKMRVRSGRKSWSVVKSKELECGQVEGNDGKRWIILPF